MKKGYRRLLLFEIVIFCLLAINSFVWNILNNYIMVIFLLMIIILFKVFFGLEKDGHRYIKDIIFDILIVLLISFLLYYLFGLIIGFYRVEDYYNLYSLGTIIIPLVLNIILTEYLRYQLVMKSEGSKLLFVITCLLLVFVDLTSEIYFGDFSSSYNIFIFIALRVLPSISKNFATCFISQRVGYKPNIFWMLIIELYVYLLPIVPNPNEYLLSVIRFSFPIVIMYRVLSFFDKSEDKVIDRNYKKSNSFFLLIPIVFVIILVYFTSGYFKYYAVAIATGSMTPNINKGDVVIIEKLDEYNRLEIGDVLAFKYDKRIIVHRIINIVEDNKRFYFYTKGDNNNAGDNFAVYEDMIVGVVNLRIPIIGYPTVWFNGI